MENTKTIKKNIKLPVRYNDKTEQMFDADDMFIADFTSGAYSTVSQDLLQKEKAEEIVNILNSHTELRESLRELEESLIAVDIEGYGCIIKLPSGWGHRDGTTVGDTLLDALKSARGVIEKE